MTHSVRFLHTADLHLDSPLRSLASRNSSLGELLNDASRIVLRKLVDTAISESVDALLIAGDLFDGDVRDVRTAKILERELRRLATNNIPVFIIWGNHDAEARLAETLDLPDNVHTFDGRGGSVEFADGQAVVHGVSFSKRQAPNSLLGKFNAPRAGCFNIGMLHTSLTGSEGHNNYAPCTVSELIDMGYDYWALGHIHKRQVHNDHPAIVMPGNPLGRHINEDGERTVTLVSLSQGEKPLLQRIALAPVRFERVVVDLNNCNERREAIDLMHQALEKAVEISESDHLVARLELSGNTSLSSSFNRDAESLLVELRIEYEHRDDVWIDSVDLKKLETTSKQKQNTNASDDVFLSSLRQSIDDELLASLNLNESIQEDIHTLIRALPGELGKIFDNKNADQQEPDISELKKKGTDWILYQLSTDSNNMRTSQDESE